MRLAQNERLLVERRRLGLNQAAMARRLDMTYRQYSELEVHNTGVGRAWLGVHESFLRVRGRWPLAPVELKTHERCVIMRVRSGATQAQVAEGLRCCRRWVMLMETGRAPCDDLTWYWEQ